MPGPLPDPNAIRRNAPTVPTTALPLSGRTAEAPDIPSWVDLQESGLAFWLWAWATPQAMAWGVGVGQESLVARRASLEDDLTAIGHVDSLDHLSEILAQMIQRLAGLASGRLQIMREMRELDDRLGLSPKGMAALRWKVVDDTPQEAPSATPSGVASMADRRARLTDAS